MGGRPFFQRLTRLLDRADRWIAEIFTGAVEADLRDAGYEVLGRTDSGAVLWVDPVADPSLGGAGPVA